MLIKEASAGAVARATSMAAEKKRLAREAAEDGDDAPGFANPRAEFRAMASVKKAITRESASIVAGKAVASRFTKLWVGDPSARTIEVFLIVSQSGS